MLFLPAITVIFWWIAIWGLFEVYTEDKTKDEKIKLYLIILGIIIVLICFFPKLLHRL
jgi:hypothetical protein